MFPILFRFQRACEKDPQVSTEPNPKSVSQDSPNSQGVDSQDVVFVLWLTVQANRETVAAVDSIISGNRVT